MRHPFGGDRLQAGDEIPDFVRTTDLRHWNRFAAVNDEFLPIHMDLEGAKAAGQPDVFGMGNLRVSYLHNVLRSWLAGAGDIVAFECEFRGLNFKHDRLVSRAAIMDTEVRDGVNLVHFSLGVYNQDGKDTCPGRATVILFGEGKPQVPPEPVPETTRSDPKPGEFLDQELIDQVGTRTRPVTSFPVGAQEIRRWAMAVYYPEDPPTEFYDLAAACEGPWGGMVAPREFNPFAWMSTDAADGYPPWLPEISDEPGHRVLNGGMRISYHDQIRPGDEITEETELVDVYEKPGQLGTMLFIVSLTRWTNQSGALVKNMYGTTIFY